MFRRLLYSNGRTIALAAAAGTAVLLFTPLPVLLRSPLVQAALDLGHVPLFAALTLLVAAVPAIRRRSPWLAPAVAVAVAAAAEVVQAFIPTRESSLSDLLLGTLGAALAAAGLACARRRVAWRVVYATVVALVVVMMAQSMRDTAASVRAFDAQMPVLATFDLERDLARWHAKPGTTIRRVTAPDHPENGLLEVRCLKGGTPGVSIEAFAEDWRGYAVLEWTVIVPGDPLPLTIRIDDDREDAGTRFTTVLPAVSGTVTQRIGLARVATWFPTRPMHMDHITEVHFFLDDPATPRTFYLDDVRLGTR